MKKIIILLAFVFSLSSCHSQEKKAEKVTPKYKISKTDTQWRSELSEEQYDVLRKKGTEASFSGKYWNHFEKGYYACAAARILYSLPMQNLIQNVVGHPLTKLSKEV